MTKYKLNQLLFVGSFSLLLGVFGLLVFTKMSYFFYPGIFILVAFLLHYQFNLVHIGSHFQLSKSSKVNNILGSLSAIVSGTTFASFTQTHKLHHRNVGKEELDPDYHITNGHGLFWIPFKIGYQDMYFFKNKLYKTPGALLNYLLSRFVQVSAVVYFIITGNWLLFVFFWLLPAWLVGYLNGLFLFYFPHYTTGGVERLRQKKRLNVFEKSYLLAIEICRNYHEKHHLRVAENRNYFPVFAYLRDNRVL